MVLGTAAPAQADEAAQIWAPVQLDDQVQYADTFGDPRGGGRTHKGVDLMAPQMHPVYAAVSGRIHRAYGGDSRECLDGGYCRSYGLLLYGDDGRSYFYLHLNDDTPGRPNGCDHVGGAEHAFSPRLVDVIRERGTLEPLPARWDPKDVVRVEQGELLGYVGSSGNAGCRVDHLHFETWAGHEFYSANDSRKDNPYPYVRAAEEAGRFWGPWGAIEPDPTRRLAGSTREATAIAISADTWEQAPVAVIAPSEVYPEALVAAPLAAALGGPVLLHRGLVPEGQPVEVDPALVEELQRLGVERVLVVSSAGAMHSDFDAALAEAAGLADDDVLRLDGEDRYELSALVAEELLEHHGWFTEPQGQREPTLIEQLLGQEPEPSTKTAPTPVDPIVALGEHPVADRGWPDALAAAGLAAAEQTPILLVRPDELPDATRRVLTHEGIEDVTIVGGPGAVGEEVEQAIAETEHETRRLAGDNRYQTALAIAAELVALGHEVADVHVATGENFPDAMASGAAIATKGQVLLLVNGLVPLGAPSVLEWLKEHAEQVEQVTSVGGPGVVTASVLQTLAIHANWPTDPT